MDSGEVLVKRLVEQFTQLVPLYAEHLADNNGELLPHVLFWEVTRSVVDSYLGRSPHLDWRGVIATLDGEYQQGDVYLRGIVEVSFLENLPYPKEEGYGIVGVLPERLRGAFDRVRPAG